MATRAQTLYKKILRAKDFKVRFVALEHFADIDEEGVIRLNLRKNNQVARNFVHEMIHFIEPKASERVVYQLESEVWNSLTVPQRAKLYKKLFR